jgi:hypothetical protein
MAARYALGTSSYKIETRARGEKGLDESKFGELAFED